MKKKHRIIVIILAVLLAIAMILPYVFSMAHAATQSSDSENETESVVSADSSESESTSESQTESSSQSDSGESHGVYIENIRVSGMSEDQVQSVIDRKIASLSADPIYLYAGSQTAVMSAGDLGLSYSNKDLAEDAVAIGKKGNVVKRFLADRYMKENGRIVLSLDLTVDESKVKKAVNGCLSSLNSDPKPVSMKVTSDGVLTAVDKTPGTKVNVDKTVSALVDYMDHDWHGGQGGINASYEEIPASGGSVEDLAEIKDELGTYTTEFDSSNTGRVANIKLAASRIEGTIVYPGEEFNFQDTVGETTKENGFKLAGSYENGSVVDTYGGGICQVSTTLYNAVLRAELEVTERSPHSVTVDYVEPSLDAAIASGSKNFRFVNNLDTPIYIHASTDENSITFTIYGKETRQEGRTLKFESRTTETTPYTTSVKLDSTRDYGVLEATGGHDGIRAEAWKIVYVNGVKQSEEQVNESEYDMSPLTYLVGIKGASESQLDALQTAAANNDITTIRSLVW
ncbi:MAG: VanW family protein [Bilifractor sp.]|jgi:vancomycin resistance protein YoaR